MKRPVALTVVVLLQWIAALIGLFGGFVLALGALSFMDASVRGEVEQALTDGGINDVSAGAVGVGVFIAALMLIAIAIVRVIVAVSLARGRNWARILLTVLSALSLAGAVGPMLSGKLVAGLVSVVVEVIILWLLWNSASSAYIKARTAEHAAASA
jgi:hypothetical protein